MNLRQLEYVVAVLDEGTFRGAAVACHVSQPALSHAVAALERELGTPLFRRAGRRVTVTAAGERVAAAARRVLRARDAVQAAAADPELASGRLVVAAPPTSAAATLVPLVAAFRRRYPGVSVRIEAPEQPERIERLLLAGGCDVGVTPRAVRPPLTSLPLGVEEFVGVFPPGTALPEVLTARHLADVALVVPVGPDALAAELTALRRSRAPVPAVETHSREAVVPLVLAGVGAAFLPRPLADAAAALGASVGALVPPVQRPLWLVYDPVELTPAARAFVELSRR
ncbi:MAG TPA: LysR family transcriptional regulator [Acidimicrobiales bacterium]|nr:LysR family transcriptional regulator [Acidimicrobiales bacterium]